MTVAYSQGGVRAVRGECYISNGDPVFAEHRSRRKDFRARRGIIGTGGKGAVAIRIDHHTDYITSTGMSTAHRDFGVPWTWANYSRQREVVGQTRPWSSIQDDFAIPMGVDVVCHSATHEDRPDFAGYLDETKTAREEMEALLPACVIETFVLPGRPGDGNWDGFMAANKSQFTDKSAGRLVLNNFGASSGGLTPAAREMTGKVPLGLGHETVEARDATFVIAKIDQIIANGKGLTLMVHPNRIDTSGYMSGADYRQVIAYIAEQRDAGNLLSLTMAGIMCADKGTSERTDLVENGSFDVDLAGWNNTGGVWSQMNYSAQNLTDVASTSTSINDQWLSQTVQIPEALRGSVFEFSLDAWHYSGSGGTDGTVRMYISGGTVNRPIGPIPRALTTPTRIVTSHLLDKRASSFGIFIAKEGAGGRLSIKNVKLRTV